VRVVALAVGASEHSLHHVAYDGPRGAPAGEGHQGGEDAQDTLSSTAPAGIALGSVVEDRAPAPVR
jgi:hypothetical protein